MCLRNNIEPFWLQNVQMLIALQKKIASSTRRYNYHFWSPLVLIQFDLTFQVAINNLPLVHTMSDGKIPTCIVG